MTPSDDLDLYTDHALADRYGPHRTRRDIGPSVWRSARRLYAIAHP